MRSQETDWISCPTNTGTMHDASSVVLRGLWSAVNHIAEEEPTSYTLSCNLCLSFLYLSHRRTFSLNLVKAFMGNFNDISALLAL